MSGIAAKFFASAIVYAILGMTLGIFMGITQNHVQMPTHAHLMLIGWVSFAIFAFFYHLFPSATERWLATAHFWLAQISYVAMVVGLFLLFDGREGAEPVVAAASMGMIVSMLLFAIVALPVVMNRLGKTSN